MKKNDYQLNFRPIARVHSCYREKFAIPRQAGLVKKARARIELLPPYNHPDMVKGLEGFSHIWLIFVFHEHIGRGYHHLISPPLLPHHEKYGVLATRAPFRPNPLGLSVVALESVQIENDAITLHIRGADVLDQTPVLDIKPYLPYSDAIFQATPGFTARVSTEKFGILFSEQAERDVRRASREIPDIREFIIELLRQDPRPKYQKSFKNEYHCKIYDYDLHWQIDREQILVTGLREQKTVDRRCRL